MRKIVLYVIGLFVFASFSSAGNTDKANPYSGQESREIKALAAEDIENYVAGKGMGLAKAAELNGYPGPSHVLTLAGELGLSPEQKHRTETLFNTMESKAKEIGRALVDEERKLDQLFASKSITPETLTLSLNRIGELQAQVRQAHLESHLAQVEILTSGQVASYMKLRGYGDAKTNQEHSGHKH
jgi:uncharacterized membrane protein